MVKSGLIKSSEVQLDDEILQSGTTLVAKGVDVEPGHVIRRIPYSNVVLVGVAHSVKINVADIIARQGFTKCPGEYPIHEQIVLVQKSDIVEWKHHPNAVFETVDAKFKDGGVGHLLNDSGESVSAEA